MSLPVWSHVLSRGSGPRGLGGLLPGGSGMVLPSVDRQTGVETLPSGNFVCGR